MSDDLLALAADAEAAAEALVSSTNGTRAHEHAEQALRHMSDSAHRLAALADELQPAWTTPRHDLKGQAEDMAELRRLTDTGQLEQRDELLYSLWTPIGRSLSLADAARAARLTEEEVKKIELRMAEEDQRRRNLEAEERVRRHSAAA